MRKTYNNYADIRPHALKASELVRKEFTWDNAAKKAEGLIRELAEKYKSKIIPLYSNEFDTNIEFEDNKPKVTFTPHRSYKKLIARIKDSFGNVRYESDFIDVEQKLYYWIAASSQIDQVTFEIFERDQLIYEETFSNSIDYQQGMELYQDQYINGEVIVKGKRDCSSRYDAMKKVFEQYNRPFTILDIGANFGYYSIRAATEYDAVSIMVENKRNEVRKLVELTQKNNCRNKLTVLQTTMDLEKLQELSKCEHFDVVLALNVIHHFDSDDINKVCKLFTRLGDNLILETPPENDAGSCGQNRLKPILDYFRKIPGETLGEFQRHTSNTKSRMAWYRIPKKQLRWPFYGFERLFEREDLDVERIKARLPNSVESDFNSKKIVRRDETRDWIPGINLKTFIEVNGIYPNIDIIINKVKSREIITNYKWDNTNNDLITHNLILSGTDLHLIDYDDKLIEEKIFDDGIQIGFILNELTQFKTGVPDLVAEENKIKLNLGCGNDIKPGYINIDKYNNTGSVGFKADLSKLPFKDNSVHEIYLSHVFEHIPINDIYLVLEEWRRVLVLNGKLIIKVPNLEREVKIWLESSDERKWFEVGRIFGSQSHEGNTHLCGFNPGSLKSFLTKFDFDVKECFIQHAPAGEEIKSVSYKKETIKTETPQITCHFVDGPFFEVRGDSRDKGVYVIDFLDPDSESHVHQYTTGINRWTRPFRKFYTNWLVQAKRNGKLIYEHAFDCTKENIMISMDSRSMGDTIAWIPYAEEFRKKHNCTVYVSSFWNHLFKDHESYKDLIFIEPGSAVDYLYASYLIGCYDEDLNKNRINWRIVPLQKVAADTLGLDYKEIVTNIGIKPENRPIEDKYVTLSEHSTFACKYWNYPDAWQIVVDYLNDIGYKVMVISKENTKLKGVIDKTNRPIEHTITNIFHSEMFLGTSAGPSWLAWGLRVPVIMVSGYSAPFGEFSTGIERVINLDVCNSCFNELDFPFDRGNWNWCPRLEHTPRQFECTIKIEPKTVIDAVNRILEKNNE